jgi:hypothetical protein
MNRVVETMNMWVDHRAAMRSHINAIGCTCERASSTTLNSRNPSLAPPGPSNSQIHQRRTHIFIPSPKFTLIIYTPNHPSRQVRSPAQPAPPQDSKTKES